MEPSLDYRPPARAPAGTLGGSSGRARIRGASLTRSRRVTSSSALAALAVLALAPAAPGEQEQTPSFSTEASAITVDVVVLDGDGQPVRDLTRDDFTVCDDGREQVIVGFRDGLLQGGGNETLDQLAAGPGIEGGHCHDRIPGLGVLAHLQQTQGVVHQTWVGGRRVFPASSK